MIDSQSVKTTESRGIRGFDAGKKVKGRKRHIITDTGGLLVGAMVHAADIQDRDGAPALLASIRSVFPWLLRAARSSASSERRRSDDPHQHDPARPAASGLLQASSDARVVRISLQRISDLSNFWEQLDHAQKGFET